MTWLIKDHLHSKYGPQWPEPYCDDILDLEHGPPDWQDDLIPCPVTAAQARVEIGRFIVGAVCNDTLPCPKTEGGGAREDPPIPEPFVVNECFLDVTPQYVY